SLWVKSGHCPMQLLSTRPSVLAPCYPRVCPCVSACLPIGKRQARRHWSKHASTTKKGALRGADTRCPLRWHAYGLRSFSMTPMEKNARRLVGVLAEFFPAGADCQDLRLKLCGGGLCCSAL